MQTKLVIRNRAFGFQKGASLLEIVAYLGVASVVIIGAISMLTSAFGGANANRALEETVGLRTGIKKLYMGQAAGFGTGDLNSVLATAKVFPSTLTVNGSTVKNAWNGAVSVTGATSTFDISYASVPQDVCASLVGAQGSSGWISVAVNGAAALTPPITPAQAGTACNASSNTVVWTGN